MLPAEAICLLDAPFGDMKTRLYACGRIQKMSDKELTLYLLQLVQALVYEPYHYSPLGEFLLERALQNPYAVGHELYWILKS